MASQYIGNAISVTLSNGTTVDGTLAEINVDSGTLTLTDAIVAQHGFEPLRVHRQVLNRSEVKGLRIVESKPARQPPALSQQTSYNAQVAYQQSTQRVQHTPTKQDRLAVNDVRQALPNLDPAILSIGRETPPSQSSHVTPLAFDSPLPSLVQSLSSPSSIPTLASQQKQRQVPTAPASVRPAPSSLASNSTIAALSTASAPQPHGHPAVPTGYHAGHNAALTRHAAAGTTQSPRERTNLARATMKKKHSANAANAKMNMSNDSGYIARRFGGAETAGSEADESHVANSEAPAVRRKGTHSSLRPRQQFVTSLQPDDTEAGETSDAPSGSLHDDFDFSRGLASFDKQQVFREIREMDKTDPSHRLIAHNKRGGASSPNPYTTKLKYNENVLSQYEMDASAITPENKGTQAYFTLQVPEEASEAPAATATEDQEAEYTEDDFANSDDGAPARLRGVVSVATPTSAHGGPNTHLTIAGATDLLNAGPSPAFAASGINTNGGHNGAFKAMKTKEGIDCVAVTDKQWKDVLQLCSIECGPDATQQIENAARGVASIVLREVGPAPEVVLLCTPCRKGSIGLRAGAFLMNHGASCTAFLPHNQHEQTPNRQSEVYLRQFSAAGGSIVRSAHELPANADIIIDALLDNEANVKRPPTQPDSSIPDAISWALSCTKSGSNTQSPQWSIDLPSNTDANTGYPSPGAIWVVSPRAVVALGFVKAPSANARYNLYLVDMGIPLTAVERAGIKNYQNPFIGDTWVTSVH